MLAPRSFIFINELADYGLFISDIVPLSGSGPDSRPTEIRSWLDHHKGVRNYLILDDESFWRWDNEEKKHVVTTAFHDDLCGSNRYYYGLYERYTELSKLVLNGDEAAVLLKLRQDPKQLIDKSHFIKDWWESSAFTYVITRPNGSGKSVNLRLLECFFSNRYAGKGESLFGGFDIWNDEEYRALQGTFPTVFLDFSDVQCRTYSDAETLLLGKMQNMYIVYEKLIGLENIPDCWRKEFEEYRGGNFDHSNLSILLMTLVRTLFAVYKKKVLIFLDGYDVPAVYAHLYGYRENLANLFSSFFISGFKGNQDVIERTVLTGTTGFMIMDLNCSFNPAWDSRFETDFGLTDAEVNNLLDRDVLSRQWNKKDEVKKWYRGYSCCDDATELYNTRDILLYLRYRDPWRRWMRDDEDELIIHCLKEADYFRVQLQELLDQGTPIPMESKLVDYYNLQDPQYVVSCMSTLMYNAGYLAAREVKSENNSLMKGYELYVPNKEAEQAIKSLLNSIAL